MIKIKNITLIMSIATLVGLSGCVTTPPQVGRFVISEEQSKLVFYDPEITNMSKEFFKEKTAYKRNIVHLGIWRHSSNIFPQARINFTELGPNYHFRELFTPGKYIESLNFGEGFPITPKAKGTTNNALGFVRFQRFKAGETECLAFTRSWKKGYIYSEVTAGNAMIVGHYCTASGAPLPDKRVLEVIHSVGIKGEGVPPPSAAWQEARAQNTGGRTIKIPLKFSWPIFGNNLSGHFLRAGQSGLVKFGSLPVRAWSAREPGSLLAKSKVAQILRWENGQSSATTE